MGKSTARLERNFGFRCALAPGFEDAFDLQNAIKRSMFRAWDGGRTGSAPMLRTWASGGYKLIQHLVTPATPSLRGGACRLDLPYGP